MKLACVSLLFALGTASYGSPATAEDGRQITPKFGNTFDNDLSLGAALTSKSLSSFRKQLFLENFRRTTAEYEMKWGTLYKGNRYDFSAADKLVDFTKDHGIDLTGHTLIWHVDTPAGAFRDSNGHPISKTELRKRMKHHIFSVMKHFQGSVDSWDVVNEALSDKPGEVFRPSSFYTTYGDQSYVVDAFQFAQEADPHVELWYNDYEIEAPAKLPKLKKLMSYLKAEGVQLTGIGFQGHYTLDWPTIPMIEAAFQAVIEEGLKIKISELDVSAYNDYTSGTFKPEQQKSCTSELLDKQAKRYRDLFQLFRKYKEHIAHVTIWGLTDDDSWLNSTVPGRSDCPLLFDSQGQAKPAFSAISQQE